MAVYRLSADDWAQIQAFAKILEVSFFGLQASAWVGCTGHAVNTITDTCRIC